MPLCPSFCSLPQAFACVFVFALSGVSPALAEGPDGDGPPSTSFSLGVAGIAMQKPYADIDADYVAVPLIQFENQYISLFGPEIGLKLPAIEVGETHEFNLSIIGRYDGSGYEAKDAAILRGMSKRKSGFWSGAKLEWKNDWFDVTGEWLTDTSGNSNGQMASISLEKMWFMGPQAMIVPYLGATWHDDKYVDYYFGVRNSEVDVGRPAYTGKAGINVNAGVRGVYMFNQQHSLMLGVEVSGLSKEIRNSPLVDRSTEGHVMFGYRYQF